MPTVRITAIDDHTDEQIKAFMDRVTDAAVDVLGAQREGVIVHFELIPATRYMRGGLTIAERRAGSAARK